MEVISGLNVTWMTEFLSETSVWDTWCLCYDRLTYKLAKLHTLFTTNSRKDLVGPKMRKFVHFFKQLSDGIIYCPKNMFHSRDSPRLLVCDTGLYLEENDIGFITVTISGGYISKNPGLQWTKAILINLIWSEPSLWLLSYGVCKIVGALITPIETPILAQMGKWPGQRGFNGFIWSESFLWLLSSDIHTVSKALIMPLCTPTWRRWANYCGVNCTSTGQHIPQGHNLEWIGPVVTELRRPTIRESLFPVGNGGSRKSV